MSENAFSQAIGNGRYIATGYTQGPWSDAHQHAGPRAGGAFRGSASAGDRRVDAPLAPSRGSDQSLIIQRLD